MSRSTRATVLGLGLSLGLILILGPGLELALDLSAPARADATDDRLFREANTAYTRGKYGEARQRYEQIVLRGRSDERLFYNLGNTYFRQGQLGRAIWAYEKALRLEPGHTEAKHNLLLARQTVSNRVRDKIIGAQKPGRWQRLVQYFSVTSAALWFFSLWYLAFGLAVTVILLGPGVLRSSLIGLAVLALLVSMGFGRIYYARIGLADNVRDAIVLDDKVGVREGPQAITKKSFDIHAGLKVHIAIREDQWVKIRLANGLEGWVRSASIGEL
jgi:Tetratricopeptide repeat/Bacterial SH3 domain